MLSAPQQGRKLWRILRALTPLEQDAMLYLASAIFAIGQLFISTEPDYVQWAEFAVIPYAFIGLLALIASRNRRMRESRHTRRGLVVSLLLLCLMVPLTVSIAQRVNNVPGVHAQDEVAVIERCGDRVANNQNCYLDSPHTVGTGAQNFSKATDAGAFVPYLPGMIIFGIPNGLTIPKPLRDARVSLTLFTLLVTILALLLSRLSADDRVRLFQFVIVLPTGALPLVTGGDDLPIIALLLLALLEYGVKELRLRGLLPTLRVVVGAEAALLLYRRLRPKSPSTMTGYIALVFFIAILLAPATRFGYLLYPANMAVWAIILHKLDRDLEASHSLTEQESERDILPTLTDGAS